MEAHAHVRSARPRVALVFSTVVLAGMLALAQWQVSLETALQDPVTVPGTELTYQPPRGWVASEDDPGTFELLMPNQPIAIKRLRLSLLPRGVRLPTRTDTLKQVQLGGLPAIEERNLIQRGGQAWSIVSRIAKTPRNEVLLLNLESRARINLGDLDMLDAVAASVSLGKAGLTISTADLLARIGITARVPDDWQATEPWSPEITGGRLIPPATTELTWTAELTRTFATSDNPPEAILKAAAFVHWGLLDEDLELIKGESAAGTAYLRINPRHARDDAIAALWLVHDGPQEMLLASVSIELGRQRDVAIARLENLLMTVGFREAYPSQAISTLVGRGETLAAKLAQGGPAPWWGRELEEIVLLDRAAGPQVYIEQHDAIQGDPNQGYVGQSLHGSPHAEVHRLWQSAPDTSYVWSFKRYAARPLGTRQLTRHIEERYDFATSTLARQPILPSATPREWSVPDNFVAQPIDILAHYQVALGQVPDCIVSLSDSASAGAHACLLRRLEPSPGGQIRVLEQRAHMPNGLIYTFGEGARLIQVDSSTFSLKQTSRQNAMLLIPNLQRLPELKTIQQSRR